MQDKGLSNRRACAFSGYSRAVGRYKLKQPAQDDAALSKMRAAMNSNPRYGYRRIAIVSELGFGHCRRLWKQEGFKLAQQRKQRRRKVTPSPTLPQQATHPNHVWTYDILFDRLSNGKQFKTLSILDEFTRECLGIWVAHSITAQNVVQFLAAILQIRQPPDFLRSDNGTEFTAHAVQDWLAEKKVDTIFIPPGQPWKNGFVESFHDKFRDECLQREWFCSLLEAQITIENWRIHYNTKRPHSSLAYQAPAVFAENYSKKSD